MPLIQYNGLPSIDRIQLEGGQVFSEQDANISLPAIKVGFLNMMPDKALTATERQFLRLIAASKDKNCYVYPFSIAGVDRSQEAREHLGQYYISLQELQDIGIDALVITGANVAKAELTSELFWPELAQTLVWAKQTVSSTICSCLATHAACKIFYQLDRKHLPQKCWGVFEHARTGQQHWMTRGIDHKMWMCHSRFNDISKEDLEKNNVQVLIESDNAGVQLAVDENCNMVYMQGHPEYDDISLLKEYKRELARFANNELQHYPLTPENYFNHRAQILVSEFKGQMLASDDRVETLTHFPEPAFREQIINQWRQPAEQIFVNWLDAL